MQHVMNFGKTDFPWEMLWYIGINVYIINFCIVPCFKKRYLSFPNVASMDLALMHSCVSCCPCGTSGKLSIGKNEGKINPLLEIQKELQKLPGKPRQKLTKVS